MKCESEGTIVRTQAIPANVNNTQPVSAWGLGGSGKNTTKPGHFVVNPPNIRPYTFYDEIKQKDHLFEDLLSFNKKPTSKTYALQKTKRTAKKLFNWALVIGGAFLAYKKREVIGKFLNTSYNHITEKISKLRKK